MVMDGCCRWDGCFVSGRASSVPPSWQAHQPTIIVTTALLQTPLKRCCMHDPGMGMTGDPKTQDPSAMYQYESAALPWHTGSYALLANPVAWRVQARNCKAPHHIISVPPGHPIFETLQTIYKACNRCASSLGAPGAEISCCCSLCNSLWTTGGAACFCSPRKSLWARGDEGALRLHRWQGCQFSYHFDLSFAHLRSWEVFGGCAIFTSEAS